MRTLKGAATRSDCKDYPLESIVNRKREIYRIMDVNLDRASEGLRVIEDAVRFGLNDYHLTQKVRQLRHFLIKVAEEIPHFRWKQRMSYREVEKDVGTDDFLEFFEAQRAMSFDIFLEMVTVKTSGDCVVHLFDTHSIKSCV